jgi:hypothetical protein
MFLGFTYLSANETLFVILIELWIRYKQNLDFLEFFQKFFSNECEIFENVECSFSQSSVSVTKVSSRIFCDKVFH